MKSRHQGRLEPFFETGSEGVIWSLHDPLLPGYEGLIVLSDGDDLTIYDDHGTILWEGIVNLEYARKHRPYPFNPAYGQQEVFGYWVHGFQADIDPPETWAQWFFDGRRAVVRKNDPAEFDGKVSPFEMTAAQLLRGSYRLWNMPGQTAPQNFQAARHTWIYWFGERIEVDGVPTWKVSEVDGYAHNAGFDEQETLSIMGSPSVADVDAWKLHNKTAISRPIFYRLILLHGIFGRLALMFGERSPAIKEWVNTHQLDGAPVRNCFFSLKGLRQVHDHVRKLIDNLPYGFSV